MSKELLVAHSHVVDSFGMSPWVPSTMLACCTDYKSNHSRKAWWVAAGSTSNLSISIPMKLALSSTWQALLFGKVHGPGQLPGPGDAHRDALGSACHNKTSCSPA